MAHNCSIPVIAEGVYPFDARGVAKNAYVSRLQGKIVINFIDSLILTEGLDC